MVLKQNHENADKTMPTNLPCVLMCLDTETDDPYATD